MFGDVLRKRIYELSNASTNKLASDAFWIILRDIAVEEINSIYPHKVDSNIAVPIYYDILSKNIDLLPPYFCEVLPSNNQERFRVINRNMWTSNAFHPDGLANQPFIRTDTQSNIERKGKCIVYQGVEKYDNKH